MIMFALHMGQLAFSAAPRSFKSDFACFWPSFLARFLACARALAFPRTIGAQQGDAETMSDPVVGGGPRAACAARERRACECRSKDANWTGEKIARSRKVLRNQSQKWLRGSPRFQQNTTSAAAAASGCHTRAHAREVPRVGVCDPRVVCFTDSPRPSTARSPATPRSCPSRVQPRPRTFAPGLARA